MTAVLVETPIEGSELERLRGLTARLADRVHELRERLGEPEAFEEDLQEAQEAGARHAALMEALQSSAPVGLACMDREFRFVRVNDALAEMNQLPAEDHIGRLAQDIAPAVWSQLEDLCHRVIETGEPIVNHEVVGDGSAGRRGHWLNSLYPVRMQGAIVGIGCLVVDVSERFQAEEFRRIVTETMVEGLYALDGQGHLTYMNAAAAGLLGWSAEELAGRDVHEAIHYQREDGSPLAAAECRILQVRSSGRPLREVADAFTRRDGTVFPVSYSAAPLPADGDEAGVVVVFRDATEERAEQLRAQRELDALHWLGRAREALDENRLVLYCQPIVALNGGAPSEELLLRMLGRDGELISPGSFLPVCETYGLIDEIDHWVISEAARIAGTGRRVELNLSAKSINPQLIDYIDKELRTAGADPANVIFELTETALLGDIDTGQQFAAGLEALGCRLALDDFGTGFASLTYLTRLPTHYLKIDVEFVRDLPTNATNQHLVKSIVQLAHGLGKETVAEGVEDEETLALLRGYGVDYAQGYHLGRPAPIPTTPAAEERTDGSEHAARCRTRIP